ncbi:MAG TPA: alkaline phosphatase family protein [Bryobacteraceae bacterium]|nr:alkaline phosphatase family protein [Bryobacteraceae bacterium]
MASQPLVVISIDGLDNRYLAEADQRGLKIPTLRKLMREGQYSEGVIGVAPTITWPSHTTIITGVDPVVHGILGNWRPPGNRYLEYSQIKSPNLIGAAHAAGLTIATITWPVTVGAPVNWNLPEFFTDRRGGDMDLRSVESKANPPNLVAKIAADYPSFAQQWMDDRVRIIAALWILRHERPALLLLHLVDLDSEEHDNAPFTREAYAVLEHTDQLIGEILAALPSGTAVSVVSDHGFERVDRVVNVRSVAPNVLQSGSILVAPDERTAAQIETLKKDPKYGIGREIPKDEFARFPSTLPANPAAVFDSTEGVMFGNVPNGELFEKPREIGNHGHWPMRYRSVYILWGSGIPHQVLPAMSLKDIAPRLAAVTGTPF